MKKIELNYILERRENLLIDIKKGNKSENIVLSFYVPFCGQKCKFCNCFIRKFNEKVLDNYVNFIKKQIEIFSPIFKNHEFDFILIGGGSPLILGSKRLEEIFKLIYKNFNVSSNVSGFCETDLNFVNKDSLNVLKKYGITDISCGIQTINEDVLKKMNRYQDIKKINNYLNLLKDFDFNINFDLVYLLPNESFESFKKSLDYIYSLGSDSINIYKYNNSTSTDFYKEGYRMKSGRNSDYIKYIDYLNKYFEDKGGAIQNTIIAYNGVLDYRLLTYYKNKDNLDYNDRRESMSQLTLGYGERSFIIGEMEYNIFPFDLVDNYNLINIDSLPNLYTGEILSLKEYVSKYFFIRFSSFIDLEKFKNIFNIELFEILGKEIKFLIKLKKINFDEKNKIIYFNFININDLILYQRFIYEYFIKKG